MHETYLHDNGSLQPAAGIPASCTTGGNTLPQGRPAGICTEYDLASALSGGQTHGAGSGPSGYGKTSSPEPGVRCRGSGKEHLHAHG